MMKMSLIDKLGVLLDIINSSKEYVLVFFTLLFVCYILASTTKKSAKRVKKISLVIYVIIIGMIIYIYHDNLSNMFDYMMNNFFIVIYFPNLAVYLAAIITTNIILWISIFNFKIPRFLKNINATVYCIMMYLLILILNIINENKLDIFTQSSVYSNSNAQALIELSSTVFIVWIAFLIIYKIIKSLIVKPNQQVLQTNMVKQKVAKPIVKKVVEKPYRQIQPPHVVKANTIKATENVATKNYDDLLTLDDYKLLLSILKEQKEKQQQERARQEKIDKEQAKFYELQQLYSNVNPTKI